MHTVLSYIIFLILIFAFYSIVSVRSGSDSDAPACKQRRMSAVIVDQSKSRSSTPDYSEKMVIDTDSKWDSNEVMKLSV